MRGSVLSGGNQGDQAAGRGHGAENAEIIGCPGNPATAIRNDVLNDRGNKGLADDRRQPDRDYETKKDRQRLRRMTATCHDFWWFPYSQEEGYNPAGL